MSYRNPFSLEGKTALVVGASRGIGLAISEAVAHAGAHTILAARGAEALQKASERLNAAGCQTAIQQVDVASASSIRTLAGALPEIDILINVSGTNIRRKFEDYTAEQYQQIMQTNLHGFFELTQLVGKRMLARGQGGKVVNIGSLTSLLGLPYLSVYAMTKSALAGMTRVLAAEWGRHNIQVNCIAPGFILTDLNRAMWQSKEMADWLAGAQPNPRLGTPEDIAPLAVFLSGPGSDYLTGQVIAVDGGYSTTAHWPFQPQ